MTTEEMLKNYREALRAIFTIPDHLLCDKHAWVDRGIGFLHMDLEQPQRVRWLQCSRCEENRYLHLDPAHGGGDMKEQVQAWARSLGYRITVRRTLSSYLTGDPYRYRLSIRAPDGSIWRDKSLAQRPDVQYAEAVRAICTEIGKPDLAWTLIKMKDPDDYLFRHWMWVGE